MKSLVLPGTLLLALLFPPVAPAGEFDMVEVEVRFFQATEKQWAGSFEGVPHSAPPAQASAPNRALAFTGVFTGTQVGQLTANLKKAGVEIAASQKMVTLSGRQLVARNVRELRYPSEFSPAKDGSGEIYPTAFETREVGTIITLTPTTVSADSTIDVAFTAQIVDFRGFVDASQIKPDTDTRDPATLKKLLQTPLKKGSPWQAIFDTREITTELTVFDDNTILLTAAPDPAEPGSHLKGILLTTRLAPKK